MPASLDFAALSLLPLHWQGCIAEHLRAGVHPRTICERLIARRPLDDRASANDVYARGERALTDASALGIDVIAWNDPAYPAPLATIADPPPVLWCRGKRAALERPAVAIVGSRAGSPYALAVAERLAFDLASRGVAIVSGLARGVDSAAHRGTLAAGGVTIAALGCGADIVYPSEHKALAAEVAFDGALVTELAPRTPPRVHFFPRRNRIISGLARAIVVIEAGEKSGSLITARCALEQGRDVLAVPGSVLNGRNRGGHALIRDGAKIVESADDILEELGLAHGRESGPTGLEVPGDPVLASLTPGEPSDVDEIAGRTGLATGRLLPRLFDLELQGLVRRAGGGRFVRTDRTC
jgi:DNA processing protein